MSYKYETNVDLNEQYKFHWKVSIELVLKYYIVTLMTSKVALEEKKKKEKNKKWFKTNVTIESVGGSALK